MGVTFFAVCIIAGIIAYAAIVIGVQTVPIEFVLAIFIANIIARIISCIAAFTGVSSLYTFGYSGFN